jgi:hypothetical protein
MSVYKTFTTDAELENRGVVLDFGSGEWVRVARAGNGNKKFAKLLEELMKPHRRAMTLGTMDDKKANEIMHRVFAEAVILDWRITGEDGKEIPFNVENALKVFADLPEFFADIKRESENRANFRREEQEKEKGNS